MAALPAALVDDFLKEKVLSQFGRLTDGSATRTAMANALVEWLNEIEAIQVEVVYDFSTYYSFMEALTETASAHLQPRLLPCHIGYLLDDPMGKEAAERTWEQVGSAIALRRHHALVDAFALRSRFEAVHGAA